ncbi:MAG: 5'-nucleosidase, partial [Bacteroidaceae bacterium]|nr:5'-nucleosidase [Bacteroidaceae bacterium]
ADTKVVAGKIATGDWFVDSVDKMTSIHSAVPDAKAVDMESSAIAHACYINNVQFVSFRVVSDIPLKENNTASYQDFWATMADKSFVTTKAFLEKL